MARTTRTATKMGQPMVADNLVKDSDTARAIAQQATASASTREDKQEAARLQSVADETTRAAVVAIANLKPDEITELQRGFAREHGGVVFTAAERQAKQYADRDEHVATLTKTLEDERAALKRDKAESDSRTHEAVRFTYRSIKVLGIFRTARELCQQYGLSEGYVSRMVLSGEAMAVTKTTSAKQAVAFMAAARDERKQLKEALAQDGATLATVREAIAQPSPKRQAQDEARALSETPPYEANDVGLRFAALLIQLSKTGEAIADTDRSTGADVLRRVSVAMASYAAKREASGKATRKASGKASGKATPRKRTAKKATASSVNGKPVEVISSGHGQQTVEANV